MAEKKSEADDGMGGAPKKKGKLLLFIIIGVLVLVLGAGGAFFMMKKKAAVDEEDLGDESPAKTEKAKKAKGHPDAPPVFVKFEPFTVKLQAENQQEAYLQATPELQVLDAPTGERVKQYNPAIRHKVLLLLSGKKPSDFATPQGVQRLSNEIREAINLILDGPKKKKKGDEAAAAEPPDQADPDDSVQAVLFTSFIIQ
jgi:flagellar FliL protein